MAASYASADRKINPRSLLAAAIPRYRDKLTADVMLLLEGPVHQSGRPTIAFGARGFLDTNGRQREADTGRAPSCRPRCGTPQGRSMMHR